MQKLVNLSVFLDNSFLFCNFTSGESAIHDACSQYNTSQFQAERGIFQEDVRKRVVQKYDGVSCDVTDLQVHENSAQGNSTKEKINIQCA